MATPFADLADLGEALERTSARLEKAALLADFLHQLAPDEITPATRLILGQPFPAYDARTLNLSWKQASDVVGQLTAPTDEQRERIWSEAVDGGEAVRMLFEKARAKPRLDWVAPAIELPLTILEVYQAFEAMADAAGKGSRARKAELLRGLLERASPTEAKYIVKNAFGEMRHGVSEGIMLDAIARAADAPATRSVLWKTVRRAHQLWGDIAEVAAVALSEGAPALKSATVRVFRPLQPMLAQTADDMADAFEKLEGTVALEFKFDGARVQVHVQGDEVRVYSRQLADVTASVPDVVADVRAGLRAREAILEGEAVATGVEGRPLPLQDLMRRFRRVHDVDRLARQIPLHLHAFDLLWLDGRSLLDAPYEDRRAALAGIIAPPLTLAAQVVPADLAQAEAFARTAYEAGHEGVMAKRLGSAYTPGVRGRHWLKLKHVETLDLVIVAADQAILARCQALEPNVRDARTVMEMLAGQPFYQDVLFHVEYSTMIHSGPLTGTPGDRAVSHTIEWLAQRGAGEAAVNYRLRDWLISRQRYWGAPIPIVYCPECNECGIVPVPEEDLPVLLPDAERAEFLPTGESPLKYHEGFRHTTCPQCGGPAERETDTMDTFMCSSWYQWRYLSPHYNEGPFDPREAAYWLPVDLYTGGIEHATMHLIYTRFFTKACRDLGLVNHDDPMIKLYNQGIILGEDNEKMSKSRGNVVDPDDLVQRYGADTVRTYLMFIGPWEDGGPWNPRGIEGVSRFYNRVWHLVLEPVALTHPPTPSLSQDWERERANPWACERSRHRRFASHHPQDHPQSHGRPGGLSFQHDGGGVDGIQQLFGQGQRDTGGAYPGLGRGHRGPAAAGSQRAPHHRGTVEPAGQTLWPKGRRQYPPTGVAAVGRGPGCR